MPDAANRKSNRSAPPGSVIPVLAYADVRAAAIWLCQAFGFKERLQIGSHRAQLRFGQGALVVAELRGPAPSGATVSVLVRIADADAHCRHAQTHGAKIISPPTDHPYGERQYTAEDLGGYRWTFSQSIADIDPATWGGVLITPD